MVDKRLPLLCWQDICVTSAGTKGKDFTNILRWFSSRDGLKFEGLGNKCSAAVSILAACNCGSRPNSSWSAKWTLHLCVPCLMLSNPELISRVALWLSNTPTASEWEHGIRIRDIVEPICANANLCNAARSFMTNRSLTLPWNDVPAVAKPPTTDATEVRFRAHLSICYRNAETLDPNMDWKYVPSLHINIDAFSELNNVDRMREKQSRYGNQIEVLRIYGGLMSATTLNSSFNRLRELSLNYILVLGKC